MRQPIRRCAVALAAVLLVAGCSGPLYSPRKSHVFPPPFERDAYAFEVRDSTGNALDHPFLGGFNLPRPQFVDIDADGDQDLFVQEVTGRIKYFENTGTPTEARLVWRTDWYKNLDVGEWYRFSDLDGDGDFDILGEEPYSYVRLFRNVGTPKQPSFELLADSLKAASGAPLFADRQNIPTIADVDCDGLLDLFIGRIDGTVMRYESVGDDADGLPRFALVTERFEDIEIVAQIGTLHGANTLAFYDVDSDGDEDLFWGDFFEPGLLLIRNTGTCASPDLRGEPISFPPDDPLRTSGYNAPVFADIDGDGDKDLFVGVLGGAFNPNQSAADNLLFFESADGSYTLRTGQFLSQVDVGAETIPAFADLDGDGDIDLLLSNKIAVDDFRTGRVFRYNNVGSRTEPEFQFAGQLDVTDNFHYAPALADLDADGDLDMLAGTWNKGITYWENTGNESDFLPTIVEDRTIKLTRGSNATPALVDIDADGDLDLFVGESSGELNFYSNTGSETEFAFDLISDKYLDIDVGRRSAPTFTDLDADGDFDLILGREADGAVVYLNVGTAELPEFREVPALQITLPINAVVTFVDIDGDGDKDFFSGGLGGGLVYWENLQSPD